MSSPAPSPLFWARFGDLALRAGERFQPLTGDAVGDAVFVGAIGDERDNRMAYGFRREHLPEALKKSMFGDPLPGCAG